MTELMPKKHGIDLRHPVVVVIPAAPEYAATGARIADDLKRAGCRQVSVVAASDQVLEPGSGTPIALGNCANNDLIRDLYYTARDFTDRAWPAPGGMDLPWLLQVEPGRWEQLYVDRVKELLPTPDASLDVIGGQPDRAGGGDAGPARRPLARRRSAPARTGGTGRRQPRTAGAAQTGTPAPPEEVAAEAAGTPAVTGRQAGEPRGPGGRAAPPGEQVA